MTTGDRQLGSPVIGRKAAMKAEEQDGFARQAGQGDVGILGHACRGLAMERAGASRLCIRLSFFCASPIARRSYGARGRTGVSGAIPG